MNLMTLLPTSYSEFCSVKPLDEETSFVLNSFVKDFKYFKSSQT